MNEKYFFAIEGQKVGPLDEKSIQQRMLDGKISWETLSWRSGMDNWCPVKEIPELKDKFAELLDQKAVPPPLPENFSSFKESGPPPLPKKEEFNSAAGKDPITSGLSQFEASCYRVAKSCFRPCFGFQSPVGKMVEKNPRSAVPVMVGTVCLIGVIVWLAVSSSPQTTQQASAPAAQQQQAAQAGGDWRAQYQAVRSAQQFSDNVIDDVYKYKRDSQDRMDETYRRANYDWYTDKD